MNELLIGALIFFTIASANQPPAPQPAPQVAQVSETTLSSLKNRVPGLTELLEIHTLNQSLLKERAERGEVVASDISAKQEADINLHLMALEPLENEQDIQREASSLADTLEKHLGEISKAVQQAQAPSIE